MGLVGWINGRSVGRSVGWSMTQMHSVLRIEYRSNRVCNCYLFIFVWLLSRDRLSFHYFHGTSTKIWPYLAKYLVNTILAKIKGVEI